MSDTLAQTGTTAETFNWDELVPATDAPAPVYQVGPIDPLTVPEPLRIRIEDSLRDSVKAITEAVKKGNKAESVNPQWKLQSVASLDMANTMVKLFRRYGSNRPETDIPHYHAGSPTGQITVRAGVVRYATKEKVAADGRKEAEKQDKLLKVAPEGVTPGLYVRYAAKPLEARKPPEPKK